MSSKARSNVPAAAVLVVLVGACSSKNASNNGDGGNGGGTCSASVVAQAANDYAFSSTLTLPVVKVEPYTGGDAGLSADSGAVGSYDLTFDWSSVTTDFIGHPVNPKTDINFVALIMWSLSLSDLETKLNADTLLESDTTTLPIVFFNNADAGMQTSAKLSDFTLANGYPLVPANILPFFDANMYDPSTHTFTLIASTGTVVGQGARMIQAFQLDPTSTNTSVTLTSSSTQLAYTADLHDLQPTYVPTGQAAISVDWSQLTTNALGNPFIATDVTSAIVAHYTQTPAQLETQFLNLQLIATEYYHGGIPSGTVADFSMLETDAGASFPGIDSTGTWIVALECGGCRNPAPWYLSILKPCP